MTPDETTMPRFSHAPPVTSHSIGTSSMTVHTPIVNFHSIHSPSGRVSLRTHTSDKGDSRAIGAQLPHQLLNVLWR